jgi:hypothetical protein
VDVKIRGASTATAFLGNTDYDEKGRRTKASCSICAAWTGAAPKPSSLAFPRPWPDWVKRNEADVSHQLDEKVESVSLSQSTWQLTLLQPTGSAPYAALTPESANYKSTTAYESRGVLDDPFLRERVHFYEGDIDVTQKVLQQAEHR